MSTEIPENDDQVKQCTNKHYLHLPIELVQKLHTFTAASNNYLFTLPVDGDNILKSAKLMNEATTIFNQLSELLNE